MTIKTTQKILQIGSSRGSIFPAKELKQLGVEVGDEVEITIRKKTNDSTAEDKEVISAAKDILKRYKKDFKNLANR